MRLSSIVSLVVVTASLALGGCAADAETANDGTQPNVALSDKDKVIAPEEQDRLNDARAIGQIKDLYENPAENTKARDVEKYKTGVVDPRLDVQPGVFGLPPNEKIGAVPVTFGDLNLLQQNIRLEEGFTPYSHQPKDP
jgi:hypothetical protein